MLKTKFIVKDLEEWLYMLMDFEYKLKNFLDINTQHDYSITTYIGKDEFIIEIIITRIQ